MLTSGTINAGGSIVNVSTSLVHDPRAGTAWHRQSLAPT
jgi:hypothetical protein